jgi:hypothetical protein
VEASIRPSLGRDVEAALEFSRFGEGVSPSLSWWTTGLLGLATMP